jgi:hypothetical protein
LPISERNEPSFLTAFTPDSRTLVTRRSSGNWHCWDRAKETVTGKQIFLPVPDHAISSQFLTTAHVGQDRGALVVVAGIEPRELLCWLVLANGQADTPRSLRGQRVDDLYAWLTPYGAFCITQRMNSSMAIRWPAHGDLNTSQQRRKWYSVRNSWKSGLSGQQTLSPLLGGI